MSSADLPSVPELLDAAVTALGGSRREGQIEMAKAVAKSMDTGEHLAVQAGTGTGKSMAYLVPSIRHAASSGTPVVVSTATLALQNQLVERDLPRLVEALEPELGTAPAFAILKGRGNYLCLNKIRSGGSAEEELDLFDEPGAAAAAGPTSWLGKEISRLHDWAQDTESGDRDELTRGVSDQAWRQVSVTARECMGSLCPDVEECFAEAARDRAAQADVVVTNHALLAIDAMTDASILPEHDVVVVDEAHELSDRVTGVSTAELTGAAASAAAKRARKHASDASVQRLEEAADGLAMVLAEEKRDRWDQISEDAAMAINGVREASANCRATIAASKPGEAANDPEGASARKQAAAALDEVTEAAERIVSSFDKPVTERQEIVWLSDENRRGLVLRVAPLTVAGLLRTRLFAESTVVLTSATLTTGGNFGALATAWGLPRAEETSGRPGRAGSASSSTELLPEADVGTESAVRADAGDSIKEEVHLRWTGLDVGSPFDYSRNAILYVAKHLPAPGRDGASPETNAEMVSLIRAAGGRALGLFSSMRGAREAAEHLRAELDTPVLLQGEDSMPNLVRRFAEDPATTLVGTLTLWQGVDVPGPSLSLVIIDRIPFPRPDDPLLSARQRSIGAHGGNGFL
ncbi:ATP-dependent DNA helicase, partial [Dietzia sp.]|uniref:ATP-dependent DNA helicase n=1 Tax=Dietzia sp. TaxID=1871616 RepID=UPI002FD8BE33